MTIAHDTATVAAVYTSTGTQNTSHAGNGAVKAAVVLIDQNGTSADEVSGVTYGGVAMTRLDRDAETTEPGCVYIYYLLNPPTGTQTVAMTTTAATDKQLVCATILGDPLKTIKIAGFNFGTSASVANPAWTISGLTAGRKLEAYEVIHSGLTTMTNTPAASWTLISSTDLGAQGRGFARQSVASSGTTLASGWTAATADDFVGLSVAFWEDWNLVPDASSSFEDGTVAGWAGNTVFGGRAADTVANSATRASVGTKSLLATHPTDALPSYVGYDVLGLVDAQKYGTAIDVWVPTGSANVRSEIAFLADSGLYVTTKDAWVEIRCPFIAPSSLHAFLGISGVAPSVSGQQVWIDNARMYALTAVSTTRATTWDVRTPVSTTRSTTWDVLAPVTPATRATTWKVRAQVSTTRATTWRVIARVAATKATSWDVLTPVSTTRSTTWRVRAPVVATRSTSWDVLAAVTATRATTWRVRAQVSTTRATTWNVAGSATPVSTTRATTWRVRAQVSTTRATSWDVLAQVSATRVGSWDVRTVVAISRSTTWDVLAAVTASRATTWRVRGSVSTTRSTTWDVRTVVASSRSTTWDVLARVTATRVTTWNVASSLLPVSTTRATTWRVRAQTAATKTTTWDVRTVATTTRSTTWDVLLGVAAARSTTWKVRAQASTTRTTSWNVRARVTSSTSTTWTTFAEVTVTRATTWDVLSTTVTTRTTTWVVLSEQFTPAVRPGAVLGSAGGGASLGGGGSRSVLNGPGGTVATITSNNAKATL